MELPPFNAKETEVVDKTTLKSWKKEFRRAIRRTKTVGDLYITLIACTAVCRKKMSLEEASQIVNEALKPKK